MGCFIDRDGVKKYGLWTSGKHTKYYDSKAAMVEERGVMTFGEGLELGPESEFVLTLKKISQHFEIEDDCKLIFDY